MFAGLICIFSFPPPLVLFTFQVYTLFISTNSIIKFNIGEPRTNEINYKTFYTTLSLAISLYKEYRSME